MSPNTLQAEHRSCDNDLCTRIRKSRILAEKIRKLMAEFDKARVCSHECAGPLFHFIGGLLGAKADIRGPQQMVKTLVAIASVQAARTSMRGVSFKENV